MKLHERSAMVFAAGLGTRMRPLTDHCPKPLIQVGGRSFLERALEHISIAGIENTVVNAHIHPQLITKSLVDHPHIQLSHEEDRLETGGGAKKALPLLGHEAFFTLNGDVIWQTDHLLQQLHDRWDDAKMDALLLLIPTEKARGSVGDGDFILNPRGQTQRLEGQSAPSYMYTGCQMIHPRLFTDTPEAFSMNLLFNRAIEAGRLYGHILEGNWFHISTVQDLETWEPFIRAQEEEHQERSVSGRRL